MVATSVAAGEDAAMTTAQDRLLAAITYAKQTGRIKSMREITRAVQDAKLGEMSDGYLSTLTTRLREDPNYQAEADKLRPIAIVCGVRPNWLLWDDGPMVDDGIVNAARERIARTPEMDGVQSQETLERVLDAFEWPAGMTPLMASNVIRSAKQSAFKAHEQLPEKYWHGEVVRLCREELGIAKAVPPPFHDVSAAARDAAELAAHKASKRPGQRRGHTARNK